MGYGLDDPGSIPSSARFSSSLKHPDWLQGPASLLANGYPLSQPLTSIQCQSQERWSYTSTPPSLYGTVLN
jgi:hypothetical protein